MIINKEKLILEHRGIQTTYLNFSSPNDLNKKQLIFKGINELKAILRQSLYYGQISPAYCDNEIQILDSIKLKINDSMAQVRSLLITKDFVAAKVKLRQIYSIVNERSDEYSQQKKLEISELYLELKDVSELN